MNLIICQFANAFSPGERSAYSTRVRNLHPHILHAFDLALDILATEKLGVHFAETPVEIQANHLWIDKAGVILNEVVILSMLIEFSRSENVVYRQ